MNRRTVIKKISIGALFGLIPIPNLSELSAQEKNKLVFFIERLSPMKFLDFSRIVITYMSIVGKNFNLVNPASVNDIFIEVFGEKVRSIRASMEKTELIFNGLQEYDLADKEYRKENEGVLFRPINFFTTVLEDKKNKFIHLQKLLIYVSAELAIEILQDMEEKKHTATKSPKP